MAKKKSDSTQSIIASAQSLIEGKQVSDDEDTVGRLEREAIAIVSDDSPLPEPTRDLINSSEAMLKERDPRVRLPEEPTIVLNASYTWVLWVFLAAVLGAAAVFLLT